MPKPLLPRPRPFVLRFVLAGAWREAADLVRSAMPIGGGQAGPPDAIAQARRRFFRIYVRHLLGLRRIDAVTCVALAAEDEGAGSQVLRILTAMEFARTHGLTYLHAPFRMIGHADRPMAEWVAAWDRHLNLGLGEQHLPGGGDHVINFDLLYSFGMFPLLGAAQPVLSEALIADFRRKYWHDKPVPGQGSRPTEICVHLRRGDVNPHDYPDMWADNAAVAETLRIIRARLDGAGRDYRIRIFSEGDAAQFAEFADERTQFHLDADPIWTLQQLAGADILVKAKSCFSYVAGLLSHGIVIGEPFFDDRAEWLVCSADGRFDGDRLERLLPPAR